MAVTVAWQEDEKRLTPDDVQAASFPLSRLGRRGLDEDHVRAFLRDLRAFFKAKDQLKQDEIAAGTCWMLKQHLPRGTKLRLVDVKAMFLEMRDQM